MKHLDNADKKIMKQLTNNAKIAETKFNKCQDKHCMSRKQMKKESTKYIELMKTNSVDYENSEFKKINEQNIKCLNKNCKKETSMFLSSFKKRLDKGFSLRDKYAKSNTKKNSNKNTNTNKNTKKNNTKKNNTKKNNTKKNNTK